MILFHSRDGARAEQLYQGNVIPYGQVNINTTTPTIQTVRTRTSPSPCFPLLVLILDRLSLQSNIAEAGTVSISSPHRRLAVLIFLPQLTLEWSRLA